MPHTPTFIFRASVKKHWKYLNQSLHLLPISERVKKKHVQTPIPHYLGDFFL